MYSYNLRCLHFLARLPRCTFRAVTSLGRIVLRELRLQADTYDAFYVFLPSVLLNTPNFRCSGYESVEAEAVARTRLDQSVHSTRLKTWMRLSTMRSMPTSSGATSSLSPKTLAPSMAVVRSYFPSPTSSATCFGDIELLKTAHQTPYPDLTLTAISFTFTADVSRTRQRAVGKWHLQDPVGSDGIHEPGRSQEKP